MKHIIPPKNIKNINIKKYTKFFEDRSYIDQDEAMHSLVLVLFYPMMKCLTETDAKLSLSSEVFVTDGVYKYFIDITICRKYFSLPPITLTLDWRKHGIFIEDINIKVNRP